MPTYQYRCTTCGHELEAVQKFSDPALTTCDVCQGPLRKVFSPVGVVFKGSGFYATDNRSKSTSGTSTPASTESSVTRTDTTTTDGGTATPATGSRESNSATPASSTPAAPKPASGSTTGA